MPVPLIPIAAAHAAGGTLVPQAAGGMIVTAANYSLARRHDVVYALPQTVGVRLGSS